MTFATLEFVSIEIGALLKGAETIGTALNIGWSFIGDGGVPLQKVLPNMNLIWYLD